MEEVEEVFYKAEHHRAEQEQPAVATVGARRSRNR